MSEARARGHQTMSTMHAASVKSRVTRLENPPINTPRILLTALNFVIIQSHARIGDSIVRRMKQIVELVGFEPETNELITNTVYEWDAATDTFVYKGHSFLFDEIMEMKKGAQRVRLPMGDKPVNVSLPPKAQVAWRMFGKFVQARTGSDPELEDNLLKAHIRLRPEECLAVAWRNTTVAAVGAVVAAFVAALFLLILNIPITTLLIIFGLVAAIPIFFSYMYAFGLPVGYHGKPAGMAKKRGHKIDKRISGAMSFISAMASADVPVDVIFKELSKQTIYGEVAKEAEWITRDTELLGLDILTAIRKAAQRSPSSKFSDFLQGVVTTSTSGGQLKPYFLVKAEQFEKEDRLEMRKKMETLGMLAESFVTDVVAFPLFLVVILAFRATQNNLERFLYWLVVATLGFIGPYGFYVAKLQREVKQIERRLPDFLRDVAEAGRFGMTLAEAIVVSSGGRYGKLTPEIKKMAAQITWGVPATEALRLFADRVKTPGVVNQIRIAFFIATVVHGLGDGILAGVLDTGKIPNGLRHSFIMLVIALFAFLFI